MRLIWQTAAAEQSPLTRAVRDGAATAVARLARLIDVPLLENELVVVTDEPAFGGYPLGLHYTPDGERIVTLTVAAIAEQIEHLTTEELRAAGLRPAAGFEHEANIWLRRQLIGWDAAELEEVLYLTPEVHHLGEEFIDELQDEDDLAFPPRGWSLDAYVETHDIPRPPREEAGAAGRSQFEIAQFNFQATQFVATRMTPLVMSRLYGWPRERLAEYLGRLPYLYAVLIRNEAD